MIHGPKTLLRNVVKLNMDPVYGEIYVPQGDHILVFSRDQEGDVDPIRVLKGPDTLLGAGSCEVDAKNNILYVTGNGPRLPGEPEDAETSQLLMFERTASGNAKPLRMIRGNKQWTEGVELITAYPPTGVVLVSFRTGQMHSENNFVAVWHHMDNGDAVPLWTIGGPHGAQRDSDVQFPGDLLIPGGSSRTAHTEEPCIRSEQPSLRA
jgi:hypothetical protein